MKKYLFLAAILFSVTHAGKAQAQQYFPPDDSLAKENLKQWQGYKFGLLMHWGTYSQWGIVESWSLCPEDEGWCARRGPYASNYDEYKKQYEALQTTFNPTQFNPTKWANAAANAGMKYMIFTTKHHDGFCMFDTKQTDYKITSDLCPFSTHPKANITAEIFDAFRKKNFWVGAYFSKPDWHSENYWWPYFPPADRNPNYDITKYPQRWQKFKQYTFHQIEELMSDYGPVNILWLDGGWVRPKTAQELEKVRFKNNQDIDMAGISAMARKHQPGILVVDRDVPGKNQNYLTPEQSIPDSLLPYPWETCMTAATSWSWVKNDQYKSSKQLVQTLITVVSRGGNLLLNIAPDATGKWDDTAYARLEEIGEWMKVNGVAIYNTQPMVPWQSGPFAFTRNKNKIYAFYLSPNDSETLPRTFSLPFANSTIKKVTLLGADDITLSHKASGNNTEFRLPDAYNAPQSLASVIEIECEE